MCAETRFYRPMCAELTNIAERELAMFVGAVTKLFGAEEARRSAVEWLEQLEVLEVLPGLARDDWRAITIAASERLADRMTTLIRNSSVKMVTIPKSNCSDLTPASGVIDSMF